MGVTRFILNGPHASDDGGLQRWAYDNVAKTFSFESSLVSTSNALSILHSQRWQSADKDFSGGGLYLRSANSSMDRIVKVFATTFALVTSWGTGGYVSVPALLDNVIPRPLCVLSSGYLIATVSSEATTSVNVRAWTSAGITLWQAAITAIPNPTGGLAVMSGTLYIGPVGSTISAKALNVSTGSVVLTAFCSADTFTAIVADSATSSLFCQANVANVYKYTRPTITWAGAVDPGGTNSNYLFLHTNGSLYVAGGGTGGYAIKKYSSTFTLEATAAALTIIGSTRGMAQTSTGDIIAFGVGSAYVTAVIAVFSANLVLDTYACISAYFLPNVASQPYAIVVMNPYLDVRTAPEIQDKTYSRRMVAIGQNRVYYEDASSQITVLSGSIDILNTDEPLTACEAFQKVFVANGSALGVADFAGTKLVTSSIGNVPARGTIVTGGTSEAQMVVDYVTNSTGTCEIYGTRFTTDSFTSSDTCTNAALSISFALAAGETAGPLWHTWSTYKGSTTYGSLPDYASLVAAYRGRLVLAGNKEYPYQWYMSRVADPWDFEYTAGDPLTAIAGSNADAGALGDIIRALIPYSPDFMIFGCANSMWLLNGDPAAGGSLDEITRDTGIYGSRSWCKDDKGDLYFFGTCGLYHMAGGRGQPSNILSAVWPNLIDDWGLNPNSHRIVMGYDVQRAGIVVCMTNLTDGTNKAFFYHVPTGAVFPETYHTECAPYSMCAYPSDDAETKGLILGCQDAYLRHFEDGATEDVGSVTTAAVISAYVGWVEKLTEDDDTSMKLNWLFIETGGAISGDTQTDTTSVNMSLYAADDAETCMQKMAVGTVAFLSTSFSGNGRQNKFRQRIKTPYLGVQFATSSAAAYWTINKIVGDVEPSGGIR